MIDKNFYLENLSAFDMLIDVKPEEAKKAIFKVYCILQRDKIWITEVADEDEITLEDVELLEDIEEELIELDKEYGFKFDEFYQLVQREFKNNQTQENHDVDSADSFENKQVIENADNEVDFEDDWDFSNSLEEEEEENYETDELDVIVETILDSAKTRFDYPLFCSLFMDIDSHFIDENLLFAIISEKANGENNETIAEKIEMEFVENGYSIDAEDLLPIIEEKANEMRAEILVFQVAVSSLNQGASPQDVLQQILHFLNQ